MSHSHGSSGRIAARGRMVRLATSAIAATALLSGLAVAGISGVAGASLSVILYATPHGTATSGCATPGAGCSLAGAIGVAGSSSGPVTITLEHSSGAPCSATSPCTFSGTQSVSSGSEGSLTIEGTATGSGSSAYSVLNGNSLGSAFTDKASFLVKLDNVTVTGGSAFAGGGIYNNGTMTVTDSTISANTAPISGGSGGEAGGGIYNNGTMTVTDSTISGNSTSSECDQYGGGIFNNATMTVTGSTISGNTTTASALCGDAGGFGGGIFNNNGTMTVTDSTISGNTANYAAGGGIFNATATMTVVDSTISDNKTTGRPDYPDYGYGGGIHNNRNGTMTVVDSTISANTATSGGGIFNGHAMTVTDSTISGNTATSGGGGIFNNNNDTMTVAGSIVADQASGGNCIATLAPPFDAGYNLSNGTSCGFGTGFGPGTGSISDATLDLGTLGNHGGPTQTVPLLGSASTDQAIGAITSPATVSLSLSPDPQLCGGSSTTSENYFAGANLSSDQRGVSRPKVGCSAGAYQYVAPPSQTAPPVVTSLAPSSGPLGGGTSVTITGENLFNTAYVLFGTAPAKSFDVISPTQVTAISPGATAPASVGVSVITPGGTSAASSAATFTYLSSSTPVSGLTGYHPITPERICDTRVGNPSGLSGAELTNCEGKAPGSAQALTIDVSGLAGIPSDATAVALDVTAIDPSSNGYLAVYPAGGSNPGTSSVNFVAGSSATANLVMVALPTSGQVSIYNSAGITNVAVDVEGYVGPETTPGTGLYTPLSPSRICDTRAGNPSGLSGAELTNCEGKAPAGGTSLEVPVLGLGGVPASNVSAVVATLTAIDPTAAGYLTAYPAGTSVPTASQVNYVSGRIVANSVIVPVGTNGAIEVYSSSGRPNIAIDVEGYFTGSANPSATGSVIAPAATPSRICDTRAGNPSRLSGAELTNCEGKTLSATSPLDVQVTGLAGVPADATAVIVNLTATDTTASSYLTAYPAPSGSTTQPAGTTSPLTSVLNWQAGQTRADLAIVPVGSGGQITLSAGAGSTAVIVDVVGWMVPASG